MVSSSAAGRDHACTLFVHLDVPRVAVEQRRDHADRDEVLVPELWLICWDVATLRPVIGVGVIVVVCLVPMLVRLVQAHVMDDEQEAPRGDSVKQDAFGDTGGRTKKRGIHGRDQVEGSSGEPGLDESGVHPRDIRAHAAGLLGRACQCDAGGFDLRHGPATLGQPDRVGALTAANVEHPARREGGHLGDQGTVGSTAPHLAALRIATIPLGPDPGVHARLPRSDARRH